MKGLGTIEYIIILGIIILTGLIIIGEMGGFGIFNFNITSKTTTKINALLEDIELKYSINNKGIIQASIKSQNEEIIARNLSITTAINTCWVFMKDEAIGQNYKIYSNTTCTNELRGITGETYNYACTINYMDSAGIEQSKTGTCEGNYEDL